MNKPDGKTEIGYQKEIRKMHRGKPLGKNNANEDFWQ
jgi:hypothetical protein